jgi:hypothetical protein
MLLDIILLYWRVSYVIAYKFLRGGRESFVSFGGVVFSGVTNCFSCGGIYFFKNV